MYTVSYVWVHIKIWRVNICSLWHLNLFLNSIWLHVISLLKEISFIFSHTKCLDRIEDLCKDSELNLTANVLWWPSIWQAVALPAGHTSAHDTWIGNFTFALPGSWPMTSEVSAVSVGISFTLSLSRPVRRFKSQRQHPPHHPCGSKHTLTHTNRSCQRLKQKEWKRKSKDGDLPASWQ